MDFNDSVVLPNSTYIELAEAAYNQTPSTIGDRVAGTTQALVLFGGLGAAVVGACIGWAKTTDWLEERRYQRQLRKNQKSSETP